MRLLCVLVSIGCLVGFAPLSAWAASITVSVASDNSGCANGTSNNTNESSACAQNGAGTSDDWGASSSASGGVSPNLVGDGSTSTNLTIDAVVAADDGGADVGQGGDRWIQRSVDLDITINIDVDGVNDSWTVDLTQSALGLFAFNGDGTLSAVGTQDNGSAEITTFLTTVDGSPYNFSATPTSQSANPSNTSSASQQFSGARNDLGILAGTGDAVINASIAFDLEALSNDGCSGFICSSASGGEEAAVLFGEQSVMDQDVDDYSFWGRSLGPDGYNSTWTLNVTVPEPTSGVLLGLSLLAVAATGRRR